MSYKLLVLDLDGTLTNNKKEITPHTLQRMIEVQQQGVKLVLASGRPTYGIMPLAMELQMNHYGGYILSYNGGKIIEVKSHEVIYETTLPQRLVPTLHQLAQRSHTTIITYEDAYILTEQPDNKYVQHELFLTKMQPRKVDDFTQAVQFAPDKCLIVGEPEELLPLEEEINRLYGAQMCAYRSEPFFLELVPKGIDKAQSLERLLNHIGGTPAEMIAVGDGFNDLSMIAYAGLGVAMANAQEAVKEVANYITLSNEEDGVAAVAERFILN